MTLQDLTGQTLAQYELHELLGVGGMGVAYRAFQLNLERDVAVKMLSPALANDPGYIERFNREAKTAASLEHTHIVPVYDYGVQGDISYVVMRYLTGGSLEDRMTQRARTGGDLPSLGEVAQLLGQLADALDYAHARGVIHRDIKPANLMFDDQGKAFVVDFGIAKLLESTTAFTESGGAMGTPLYMPPEQWRSEPLTPAADQYALAVTIFHLMTGRLPFEASTPYGMLHKHLNEAPTTAQTFRHDVPDALVEVLNRALAKDPAERYETVTAFADAFAGAVREESESQTGFFTQPILHTKTPATLGGSRINILISPDSPLVTQPSARTRARSMLLWVASMILVVVITAVLLNVLTGDSGDSSDSVAATQAAMVNGTVSALALTNEANLAMTAAELNQTLAPLTTSEAQYVQTVTQAANNRLTTQIALTVQAEITQTEDAAAGMTSTADAWTATPMPTDPPTDTPTDTPTDRPTNTPAPTATDRPVPTATVAPAAIQEADLRAVYNADSFVLTNVSGREVDINGLIFELPLGDGRMRTFSGVDWARQAGVDTIAPRRCMLFSRRAISGRPQAPPPDVCPGGLDGWFGSSLDLRFFWDDRVEDAEAFTVWFVPPGTDPRVEIAECSLTAGECEIVLPSED